MCLCCTRFPRTTLSRANSAQQSTVHKASYLPRCASPAPGRWSHCKATASPANPPEVSVRSTWSNAQQRPRRAFRVEPVILHSLSPVLPLTPVRPKLCTSTVGLPCSSAAPELLDVLRDARANSSWTGRG